jgi:hypothetical protein
MNRTIASFGSVTWKYRMPSTCSCVLSRVMQIWLGTSRGILAQIVPVRDAIDERNHEIQAGLEHRVETAQALDDPRVLLRNHADRLDHDDDRDDEQRKREDGRTVPQRHGDISVENEDDVAKT